MSVLFPPNTGSPSLLQRSSSTMISNCVLVDWVKPATRWRRRGGSKSYAGASCILCAIRSGLRERAYATDMYASSRNTASKSLRTVALMINQQTRQHARPKQPQLRSGLGLQSCSVLFCSGSRRLGFRSVRLGFGSASFLFCFASAWLRFCSGSLPFGFGFFRVRFGRLRN